MPVGKRTARETAIRDLMRVEEEGAFVGLGSEGDAASARERRQAREYVAGVTRQKRYLDFVLAAFVRGPIDALEPVLRQILRVGLYDLLFLETPPHAAVNEAVALTRRLVREQAARLTNAVLRNVIRSRGDLPEPRSTDPADAMGIRHSHPTWIVRRWLDRFGTDDTARLLAFNNRRPEFGIRVNLLKTSIEEVTRELDEHSVPWSDGTFLPEFLRVRHLQALHKTRLLALGNVSVQDESAGLIVATLDPQPGERMLDLCSAPGGKAMFSAERMRDEGEIVSVDVHAGRLSLLEKRVQRLGLESVETLAIDARQLSATELGAFDRVLLDAPCSGLGVLGRRADLRWKRSEEDLASLTILQAELLASAARFVRPGGVLVYGTCTIEPEENDAQINAFLSTHTEFEVDSLPEAVPESVRTSDGYMATLPHVHGVDGAFAARLRRRG